MLCFPVACCGVFQDVQYVQTEHGTVVALSHLLLWSLAVCLFHWFLHNEVVRDGAGATRVGKHGGVACEDVSHGEKRGGAGAGLG
ncbi:hypothetical protein DVH24_009662 [Malus domestica]|uniref:Uncharacterized protein n=1 Tax=Malus domestica TaxID=3750 RepID=A0A498JMP5_MALDO|nr:hypothetical protein DVH24_009662 [Malus domestica]